MSATTAESNYIAPTQALPGSFTFEPAVGRPRSIVTTAPHGLPVQNLRKEDRYPHRVGETYNVTFGPAHRVPRA